MSSSGVYVWPLTFGQLATASAQELGALAMGATLEAEELSDMMLRFNAMLKSWDGALYRDDVVNVTVTGGTTSVAAPASTRDITSIRHVLSATYNRQLAEWNRADYYSVPNRAQAGNPVAYYIAKGVSGLTIYVWPVPAADITLELDRQKLAETVTDQAQTIDVPEEWQETLVMGLASRCASIFGTTRIDPGTVQRVDSKAAVLYAKMLDRDRPDSYFLEPDC